MFWEDTEPTVSARIGGWVGGRERRNQPERGRKRREGKGVGKDGGRTGLVKIRMETTVVEGNVEVDDIAFDELTSIRNTWKVKEK